jgi:hypothetical protein
MKVLPLSLRTFFAVVLLLSFLRPTPAGAYSVLSHEEVVDMAWLPHIVPLLRARYPDLTDDELTKAHAYAYGGSVIQDIGYYPFGSHDFSDLLHYVRTGDFVSNLIRESTNVNEYAFALGALAHYCGDVVGHPAVNSVTSDEYPKLRKRFGMIVTYDQDKVAHLRTEFGFDVVQVAHGRYSQQNYRDFIGFQVSKELLERAFQETYGIPVDSVMKHEDLAIGSYRRAVSSLIPNVTTVALVSYKDQIEKENPGFDRSKFIYRLKRTEFNKEYGRQYAQPGAGSHVLAFFIRILPKIGPLKVFRLQIPNADEQDVYLKSINGTVDKLNGYLVNIKAPADATAVPVALGSAEQLQKAPDLAEIDLDTGKPSQFGEYHLADLSYASLLDTLLHDSKVPMKPDVYQSFRDFYSNRKEPVWYVKKHKDWKRLQADLVLFDALPKPVLPPAGIAMVIPPVQH